MRQRHAVPGCTRVGHACQTILACIPYESLFGRHKRPSPVAVSSPAPRPGVTETR